MAAYNFLTLIHRELKYRVEIPGGDFIEGTHKVEIPIRIPKIQRDYAEGRSTEMIERKRLSLLNDMIEVVYGVRNNLSFDFVYGYMIDDSTIVSIKQWNNFQAHPNVAFEPLDGQQRLTTLFLFYWFFGREQELRKDSHSLFIYETRDTSEEFCHWLVNQEANTLIDGWRKRISDINKQNEENEKKWKKESDIDYITIRLRFPLKKTPTLFEYMQQLEDFKWDWHDDPNIHSMITVIESIEKCLREQGRDYQVGISQNGRLDNITFMLLDNLDCDGDRLFEKMNARGKALTSFEILKSSLEEEMELQGLPQNNEQFTSAWRESVDGKWIDFCWDRSNLSDDPKLDEIREVETKLERLLVRLAGKSFFKGTIQGSAVKGDAINYAARLRESIYKRGAINDVINRYIEYARHERSVNFSGFSKLDFSSIYSDIENLLYMEGDKWHDASELLPQLNRENKTTLLEEFLDEFPTHDTRVMIYAMLQYLKITNASSIAVDSIKKKNFIDWMRFIRNIFNSNNKNSRLDSFEDVQSAIDAVDNWLEEYRSNYITNSSNDVLQLIAKHIHAHPYGQEHERLNEEKIKADLRMVGTAGVNSIDWEKSILDAEDNYYLWGQIIAPLSWSKTDTSYDKAMFDKYMERLNLIFNVTQTSGSKSLDCTQVDALIIQVMLCRNDYRHNNKNGLGSLGRFNDHRDCSWKQYLRKSDTISGLYGSLFKDVIDEWMIPEKSTMTFEEFLRSDISLKKGSFNKKEWTYYLVNISKPNTLLEILNNCVRTNNRYLYTENGGHAYYFRSDTQRTTIRYEILTTYLHYETQLLCTGVRSTYLSHTAEIEGAYVDFETAEGVKIRLSLGVDDKYNIEDYSNGVGSTVCQNIDILDVEKELIKRGVIKSL